MFVSVYLSLVSHYLLRGFCRIVAIFSNVYLLTITPPTLKKGGGGQLDLFRRMSKLLGQKVTLHEFVHELLLLLFSDHGDCSVGVYMVAKLLTMRN